MTVSSEQIHNKAFELVRSYAAAGKVRNDALAVRDSYIQLAEDKNTKFTKIQQLPDIFPGESWLTWNMLVKNERVARTLANIRGSDHYNPQYDEVVREYIR